VETLTIFDWDDTLFPTTWLQQQGLFTDGAARIAEEEILLQRLAQSVRLTLEAAMQIGKVIIVTNAQQGWIEMSCTAFMPSLVSLVKTLDIVSARSTYEQFSDSPAEWKRLAFEKEIEPIYGNVLSVGDLLHELLALKCATKDMTHCCKKSIKLLEAPSIEQLVEQHEVLSSSLMQVLEENGDLDMDIGVENSN